MNHKVTEVKDSCNCLWKHCAHHQTKECPHDAVGWDCGGCTKVHWLGDHSLGEGFRLCTDCAGAIMEFIGDDLPHFMHDLAPYVPLTLKCLESVLKDYYLSYVTMETTDTIEETPGHRQRGWRNPIRDSRALMEFAGIIINAKPKTEIPLAILQSGVVIAKKHKDLMEAFADFESTSILKEENK